MCMNGAFAKYNVLRVTDMFDMELGMFMYRHSINKLPSSFENYYFTKWSDVHNYPKRHGKHLNVPKNKKTFSDYSVRTIDPPTLEFSRRLFEDLKVCETFP